MTRSQDASSSADDQAGGERIVIRDKRKVTPGGGKLSAAQAGQPADSTPTTAEGSATAQQGEAQAAPAGTAPSETAASATAPEGGDVVEGSVVDGDVVQDDAAQGVDAAEDVDAAQGDAAQGVDVAPGGVAADSSAKADVTKETAPDLDVSDIAGPAVELAVIRRALEERTADLQRMTAEYANYRKRVERDRAVSAEQATGVVLAALLPMLDDLDRAREHGDLTGPFASVAEQLNVVVAKFGLVAFGAKGDLFDPNRHEAVAHLPSAEVTEPTCIDVMRRGYLLGERLLRPAMVAVAAPE